jgi:formylglycine-generating enzyme required for sulfatase activity
MDASSEYQPYVAGLGGAYALPVFCMIDPEGPPNTYLLRLNGQLSDAVMFNYLRTAARTVAPRPANLASGQVVNDPAYVVQGNWWTNVAATALSYRVNGGAWSQVAGTTRWEASLAAYALLPGNNVFEAYSLYQGGVKSRTNSVSFIYVPSGLQIQLYAGLTIPGPVGGVYAIQYVTDLNQTDEQSWRCLTFLQLPASPYVWSDTSAPATKAKRFYRAVPFAAPANMVFSPSGTFRMGTPSAEVDRRENEGPQTVVALSRGFWMGQYEVTQNEYQTLMGNNPSYFNGDRSAAPFLDRDYGVNLNRPVEQVSWFDANSYCDRLTQQERNAGRIPINCVYRLPTEAEWQYACRAWTSTRFNYGEDPGYANLGNYAWFAGNSEGQTHSVGLKPPNLWGLYDMHGNVSEWCQDWLSSVLPGGSVMDPRGPASGEYRTLGGGGSYLYNADWCRSGGRDCNGADAAPPNYGFRVVLAVGEP